MRFLVCGLVLLATATSPVFAGDFGDLLLRGSAQPAADPPNYPRWGGAYGGGQVGVDFRGVDFRDASGASIANIMGQDAALSQLPVTQLPQLPAFVKTGASVGGFFGYNYQIDDVVVGLEANFNWADMGASGASSQSRNYIETVNSHIYSPLSLNVSDGATVTLNGYGSARTRFAWAYENFLPYGFVGFSVAQVNTTRFTNVNYTAHDVTPGCGTGAPNPPCLNLGAIYTQGDQLHGKYVIGYNFGVGLDILLTQHFFWRSEIEYLQLSALDDIKLNTTSVRTGLGYKF
jgi:outer membrane immunogenic protein